jgi:uncharacterized protein (DUF427 family)
MTLTRGTGPLSRTPGPSNYTIEGPAHRILVEPSPKRVRIEVAGEIVADTAAALMLHETGLLPVYYFPLDDIRSDLLHPTDHHTTCPFKGEASYWSLTAGDRVEENLVWTYPEPLDEVAAIAGHAAFYLDRADAVYEESVRLLGHPRDPYHRVDTMRSDRSVRVSVNGEVVAETSRPMAVFETGLPPRWYIPRVDVRADRLVRSDTVRVCPYKGVATYWSLVDGAADVAWEYAEPLPEATGLPDHLCFLGDDVTTEVAIGAA